MVGLEVEQVSVWWSLRLVFDLGSRREPGVYVDVTYFTFTDAAGVTRDVDIESHPVGAGGVLEVLHRRVAAASAEDWTLKLTFETGARLVCPPHTKFEAWQALLPGGGTIWCPPGGGDGSPH